MKKTILTALISASLFNANATPYPKVGDTFNTVISFENKLPTITAVSKMSAKSLEKLSPNEKEIIQLYDYKLLLVEFSGSVYLVEDNELKRVVSVRVVPAGCLSYSKIIPLQSKF